MATIILREPEVRLNVAHFSGCLFLLDCHNKGIDFTSHSSQINCVGCFQCVFTLQTARLDYVRSGRGP